LAAVGIGAAFVVVVLIVEIPIVRRVRRWRRHRELHATAARVVRRRGSL